MDTSASVHCEILKILRLYGADGNSCLDMADSSVALKELLTEPLDICTVSIPIPWTSTSKKYEVKLAKVARRQECDVIHEEIWYHKEHVGSGSFGHVFIGINEKDGREVAVKRIEKLRMQRPEDKREITNVADLADCEQIVRYLHFFEEEKFSYIILELMEGNLDEYLTDSSTFDATKSTQLCQDVVKGLKFLHEQNIIHRDLKPGNILYKTHPHLRLKIADFGLSRRIDSSATTVYGTNAGTRCWMAPEVLMDTPNHSKASDMFSCGLVLHYILSVQKHPYSKNNSQKPHQIETNMTNGSIEGWDDCLSPEATHLVKNMLGSDKDKRPVAAESLDHPMFWSDKKKVDVLVAVGNQSVFGYQRATRKTLTAVEADLEKSFSTIVVHGVWNDPRYKDMPHIYAEMTSSKRKYYDNHSVVELVRFIRNAYAHVSEGTRKMLLDDFVFLKYFFHLVMEVYKVVTDHGWNQTIDEVKYAINS
uniref:Myosin light chain kinase A-like n=1 Tax=Actinia tenebrosa TaxID=6105 RepID=A0A6P8H802_ACTTE